MPVHRSGHDGYHPVVGGLALAHFLNLEELSIVINKRSTATVPHLSQIEGNLHGSLTALSHA